MKKNLKHITPVRTYLFIGITLLLLTIITVEVSFIDFGGYNIAIALAIASIKALLVAFFFMHLFYDNKLYLIIYTASLVFLTIFLTLTMFDTGRRGDISNVESRPIQSESSMYQKSD